MMVCDGGKMASLQATIGHWTDDWSPYHRASQTSQKKPKKLQPTTTLTPYVAVADLQLCDSFSTAVELLRCCRPSGRALAVANRSSSLADLEK